MMHRFDSFIRERKAGSGRHTYYIPVPEAVAVRLKAGMGADLKDRSIEVTVEG